MHYIFGVRIAAYDDSKLAQLEKSLDTPMARICVDMVDSKESWSWVVLTNAIVFDDMLSITGDRWRVMICKQWSRQVP
eukprot:scaffold26268_cov103-Cylindrotheca_fusiformis.AAC.3